jgi:hypothetical protein
MAMARGGKVVEKSINKREEKREEENLLIAKTKINSSTAFRTEKKLRRFY